jgi:acyl carrier protein
MHQMPAAPAQLGPDSEELVEAILEALSKVRATPLGELRDEMAAAQGDLEIDSREAEAVIAMLEERYGRTLAKVEDLEPERLLTAVSLAELIHRRWPAVHSAAQRGSR